MAYSQEDRRKCKWLIGIGGFLFAAGIALSAASCFFPDWKDFQTFSYLFGFGMGLLIIGCGMWYIPLRLIAKEDELEENRRMQRIHDQRVAAKAVEDYAQQCERAALIPVKIV